MTKETQDRITIQSAQGNYSVHFFDEITASSEALEECMPTHFVVDQNVYNAHADVLTHLIKSRPKFLIEATEETKTLQGVERLTTWLQKHGANRTSRVVAIGGGITQDLTAFTAHLYYRGIPWVFLPTTLLAMCDSSIGAKCGVNLNEFKNQLGTFQAPKAIFTCSKFLDSLPDFHISSGYGEVLKLFLTNQDSSRLDDLEKNLKTGLRNPQLLNLIRTCLVIKQEVIEIDEYESDLRRILNYGHTFGHAMESLTNYEIPHGLAVAKGLDLVNFLAVQRGYLEKSKFDRIHALIQRYLPFRFSQPIEARALIDGARKDKKTDQTGVNLIFHRNSGKLEIKKILFDEQLRTQIEHYLSLD